MSHTYIMSVDGSADEDEFVSILNKNLYPNTGVERNRWFYSTKNTQRYLLCDYDSNEPIGGIGFYLRPFLTPYGVKIGALAADLSVNEEHRNLQNALSLVDLSVKTMLMNDADFVYTIPNRNSKLVVKRTGLFQSAGLFQRHVKLIKVNEAVEGKPYAFLAPVANVLMSAFSNITNLPRVGRTMVRENGFDDIGSVWYSQNETKTVMGIRDERYLRWRYNQTPDAGYQIFHVVKGGQHAYLVYKVIKDRAYVVDLVFPKDDYKLLIKLFATFEMVANQSDYSMIVLQYLGADPIVKTLAKSLWYRQHTPTNKELLVASDDNHLLECLVKGDKYWFAGDEDDIS